MEINIYLNREIQLTGAAEAVCRGRFTAINATGQEKRKSSNNLALPFKKTEKEETTKLKVSRRKELTTTTTTKTVKINEIRLK